MMKNADKLKEKAEMTIQAKGWLSNVVHNTSTEDFDDFDDWDELIDCDSVDFFIVWHRFANYNTFPKH